MAEVQVMSILMYLIQGNFDERLWSQIIALFKGFLRGLATQGDLLLRIPGILPPIVSYSIM